MQSKKTCDRCNGRQRIPDPNDDFWTVRCPKCKGEGIIDRKENNVQANR